jgi:tetratricopeptide (TPR) repeat protein
MEEVDLLTTIKHGQNQAEMYLFQGNLTQAVHAIQSILKIAPATAETLKILGNIQQKQGNLVEAKNTYLQAIQLNPNFAPAYANLGSIYALEQNWHEAIQYYQKAIQLAPNLVGVYRNLGKIWQHLGNDSEFYKCHYYVIMADDNIAYYNYVQLGHKLLKIGEKDKAIDCYKRCLEIHPQHFIALAILGDLSAEDGDFQNALNYYEKSLETHINPVQIYRKMADTYLKQENLDKALFYFVEVLKYQPGLIVVYKKIRQILEQKNLIKDFINNDIEFPPSTIAHLLKRSKNNLVASTPELIQIDITPAEKIKLNTSITIKQTHRLFVQHLLEVPSTYVYILPQAKIWADNMNAVVMNQNSQILRNISVGFLELIAVMNLPEIKYYPGTLAFLTVRWGEGYFHWMFDLVARIKLLQDAHINLNDIDYFVINHYQHEYRQETLSKLGIPLHKIIVTEEEHYIQTDNLIMPSHPHLTGERVSPWACQFLKDLFLPAGKINSPYGERIYISRAEASRRRILNESEIFDYLTSLGFMKVCLESMSIEEQAICLAGAKVIIAPHGAGLTNLIFCQAGTKVIELFSDQYVINLYWKISTLCNLQYYYLINQTANIPPEYVVDCQDIWVDRDNLLELLKLAEVA